MVVVAAVLLGGLLFLAVLSMYSALMISKRTEEMVTGVGEDDESPSPMLVRFPDSVFRIGGSDR
jgi:hypothetical protein